MIRIIYPVEESIRLNKVTVDRCTNRRNEHLRVGIMQLQMLLHTLFMSRMPSSNGCVSCRHPRIRGARGVIPNLSIEASPECIICLYISHPHRLWDDRDSM